MLDLCSVGTTSAEIRKVLRALKVATITQTALLGAHRVGIDLGNGLQAFGGVALQAQQSSVNAGLIRSADGDSRCREAHFLELHRQLGDDRVLGRYIEVAALLIVACPPIDCAGLVEWRKRPAQSHTQHQGLCCA